MSNIDLSHGNWRCSWFQRPPKPDLSATGRKARKAKDDIFFKARSHPILLISKGMMYVVGGTCTMGDISPWEAFVAPIPEAPTIMNVDEKGGGRTSPRHDTTTPMEVTTPLSSGSNALAIGIKWEATTLSGKTTPLPRSGHSITNHPNGSASAIMFGGCTEKGCVSEMWEMKVESNGSLTWTQQTFKANTSVPPKRYGHAAVMDANGLVYIHGGCANASSCNAVDLLDDLWVFDPSTRIWTDLSASTFGLPLMEKPAPRCNHTAIIHNGHFVILGGWDGVTELQCVWSLLLPTTTPQLNATTATTHTFPLWNNVTPIYKPVFGARIPAGLTKVSVASGIHIWFHTYGITVMDCSQPNENPKHVSIPQNQFLHRDVPGLFWDQKSLT
eukprot:PhF_6_TR40986/c0_g1_i2/m.62085